MAHPREKLARHFLSSNSSPRKVWPQANVSWTFWSLMICFGVPSLKTSPSLMIRALSQIGAEGLGDVVVGDEHTLAKLLLEPADFALEVFQRRSDRRR